MIITYVFTCEVCGKQFGDEEECEIHEQLHLFEKVQDSLFLYSETFDAIPWDDTLDFDDVCYVRWLTKDGFQVFYDWVKKISGDCSDLRFFCQQDQGLLYWERDCWNDFLTLEERYNEMREIL